ncbi:Chromo domain/shadow [Macrophomina phaseolina MS6]|uniref:Chromo domain/shadow n=1 Tax=Macrophomina phaseolina (strain MS6) TaxID=1126212 RepID=K2R849_MACPH|nr:Chromo domain/shadow [Macrophomina phaseolina MS6]
MHFNIGQPVLLSARNIRTKRPCKKLDNRYLGPFRILEKIGPQAYRLDLPQSMSRLHNVFNVALLEAYTARPGFQPPPVEEIDDGEHWEVEAIVAHKEGPPRQYLLKWLGWPHEHNEWKQEEELDNCRELLQDYLKGNPIPWDAQPKRKRNAGGMQATSKPRRGRPPGSKNKKKY